VTAEYSFCGSNASCTSEICAMCSVPPAFGAALLDDGAVLPLEPLEHAAPSTTTVVASAMRIPLLAISSSSGDRDGRAGRPYRGLRTRGEAPDSGSLP
jgi:hypothetical protein